MRHRRGARREFEVSGERHAGGGQAGERRRGRHGRGKHEYQQRAQRYFILEGSRIVRPATMNIPRPMWWIVFRRMSKVALRLLTMQPTSGGSNSIIVCQDIVMTFARPWRAVVRSTTGPGSSRR